MSDVALHSLLDCAFRSSSAYDLVTFDRLLLHQKELLRDLTRDPDFYGVLLPRNAEGRVIKSVSRDIALLIQTMCEPGPLPNYARQMPGGLSNCAIAQLVLDGVLEIEHEGRFVSGSEAYPLVYAGHVSAEPRGLLPRLSRAALEYAQALAIDDVVRLSGRLYFYNRLPLTPYWTHRLPNEEAVWKFLGLADSTNKNRLRQNWTRTEHSVAYSSWFQWQSRLAGHDRPGYKLYVSPPPDAMPAILRAVIGVLDNSAAVNFKVGCDACGLLRPDKLVIYFQDFDPLRQAAHDIALHVAGCEAHGVPFTAAIGNDGLLSWGVDPPPEESAMPWQGPESWRLWITNRLATALVSARSNCTAMLQPWEFALERLRLEDVDTDTWTPIQGNALSA